MEAADLLTLPGPGAVSNELGAALPALQLDREAKCRQTISAFSGPGASFFTHAISSS